MRRILKIKTCAFGLFGLLLLVAFQACSCGELVPCDKPTTCATGESCVAGYCRKPCSSDGDCGEGQKCGAKVCWTQNEEVTLTEPPVTDASDPDKPGGKDASSGKDDDPKPEPRPRPDEPGGGDAQTPGDKSPDGGSDGGGSDAKGEPGGDKKSPDGQPGDGDAPKDGDEPSQPDGPTGVCTPNEKRLCYSGQPGTSGTGPCKMGEQLCNSSGQWGRCEGEVPPKIETCDGVDNDCDGSVDEDYPQKGGSCVVNEGECAGTGKYTCTSDGKGLYCKVEGKQSSPEVCDGKDNDCDGLVDETFANKGQPCFDGTGVCRRQGAYVCTSDGKGTECSAKQGPPLKERCNDRDDDCDGSVDEDFTDKGKSCTVGVGGCQATGTYKCASDGTKTICDATPSQPKAEVCDGIDNDCNGQIDDKIQNLPLCANQQGVCKGARQTCVAGKITACTNAVYKAHNSAFESLGTKTEAACDGLDNNCNGSTDETWAAAGLGKACSVPQCLVPPGVTVCNAAKTGVECNIKQRKETCANAQDDNCDGTIDEGCPRCTPQTSQACYFGPPGTEDIGQCSGSSQSCNANGVWGDCAEWTGPAPRETCGNGVDNTCDGLVSEGCKDCSLMTGTRGLSGHTGQVNGVAGRYNTGVSGSDDKSIRIWDLRNQRLLYTGTGHTEAVRSVAMNRSSLIASGSLDKTIRLWTTQAKAAGTLTGHTDGVESVKFSRDSKILASGSRDRTVRIWSVQNKTLTHTFTGHTAAVVAVDIDLRDKYVVSGSADKSVRLWDIAQKKAVFTKTCAQAVTDARFGPDGTKIIAACGGLLVVWDVATGNQLKTFTLPVKAGVTRSFTRAAFVPSGDYVIGGTTDGEAIQFSYATAAVVETYSLQSTRTSLLALEFNQDNRSMLTGGTHNLVQITYCAAFLPSQPACIPNNQLREIKNAHTLSPTAVLFSRFARYVISGSQDKTIKIWDVKTGNLVRTLSGHTQTITGLSLSGDGAQLASSSTDGTVRIWEVATGKLLHTVTYTGVQLFDVAFNPRSPAIVAAASDNKVKLIDATTGKHVRDISGHQAPVRSVAYNFGGFYILSGDSNGVAYQWNTNGTSSLRNWTAHAQNPIFDVAFANSTMLTMIAQNELKVWDSRARLQRTLTSRSQRPHVRFSVSPDNSMVGVANSDGAVYFNQISNGSFRGTLFAHTLRLSPGAVGGAWDYTGQLFVTAGLDKSIKIWDCQQQPLD